MSDDSSEEGIYYPEELEDPHDIENSTYFNDENVSEKNDNMATNITEEDDAAINAFITGQK